MIQNKSIKISLTTIVWFFIFICLLRPPGLIQILGITRITKILLYACVIIMALLYTKILRFPVTAGYYFMYLTWLLIVTLLRGNRDSLFECIYVVLSNIGMVLFVIYIIKKDTLRALLVMYWTYLILLTLNLYTIIRYPQGFDVEQYLHYGRANWLFGHVNSTITYVFPAICIGLIYAHYDNTKKAKYKGYFLVGISVITIIFIQSMTSTLGLAVFVICFTCLRYNKWRRIINIKKGLYVSIILFILIVFLNIQNYFSDFFENVLNRSLTFTGRTTIWENSINIIKDNWILGLGYNINTYWQLVIRGSSAHNEYLYCILQGGIIMLIIFILFFLSVGKSVSKNRDNYISQLLISIVISLLIQFLFETHMHRIPVLIALFSSADILIKRFQQSNTKNSI